MMFFRGNGSSGDKSPLKRSSDVDISSFFGLENKDQVVSMVSEMSLEAKEFFESNIGSMLGNLPEEIADVSITINRESLKNLLFSSMVTGYIAKSVESRLELNKLISSNLEKALIDDNSLKFKKEDIDDVI